MSSPLEAAGATREPSEYATLSMDRAMTGLWTQRSPLRDADVPYLYNKFYSASRFDSLIDGLNREVTAKLTIARRAGTSAYNANSFPAINSFYSYKRISNGVEIIRVIADGADGTIYDATAGQKSTVMVKGAGAGKARFQGVNASLYITDGVENKKYLQPSTWALNNVLATTQYQVGTLVLDSNGKIQYLTSVQVGTVTNVALIAKTVSITLTAGHQITTGMSFSVVVATATFLNGARLVAQSVLGNVVNAFFDHVDYISAADSGPATTTDVTTPATTGGSQPSWAVSYAATTTDGLSTWTNFGVPLFNWGVAAPASGPQFALFVAANPNIKIWQPFSGPYNGGEVVLASNGFVQMAQATFGFTAGNYPVFQVPPSSHATPDGNINWYPLSWLGTTLATSAAWVPSTALGTGFGTACVDSNGNLQTAIGAGTTGGAAPAWNTTYGGLTTDNGIAWKNMGPYLALSFRGRAYGYAYHSIDGSVSTLSPLSGSTFGVADGTAMSGKYSTDTQVDSVWIFHTADSAPGTGIPLFIASIPNNASGGTWSFTDQLNDFNLNALITGPQFSINNPPPIGMTAPIFHLGRICAIYKNTVILSGGPNTLVGNGNTAFSPSQSFQITEQPVRLFSGQTSAGPAIFIWGTSNIWVIVGAGTVTSPFQQPSVYMAGVGVLNYDAICNVGSSHYCLTSKGKFVSLDPGAGYVEVGFPIGDQFKNVSTGAGGKVPSGAPVGALYNPSTAFVTWSEVSSGDTAVYVSDGSIGWFRYSPVASPESGFLWSPRAVLASGTSAVQSIETAPGVDQLLIGPGTFGGNAAISGSTLTWISGSLFSPAMVGRTIHLNATDFTVTSFIDPQHITYSGSSISGSFLWVISVGQITFRDASVNADFTGVPTNGGYTSFPSYDVKGNIVVCQSGEVAEVAHIGIKSIAIGAKPLIGLLFGEIAPTQAIPFDWLTVTSNDPPDIPPSTTLYSDRYSLEQNGTCPKCDNFQLAMDYGIQNVADETIMFSVYGAKHAERRQQ